MDVLNSRMERTEERIREDEYKTVAIAWFEQQRESQLKKKKQSLSDMGDRNKRANINVTDFVDENRFLKSQV